MLLRSCMIAGAVSVVLCILILLKSKYERSCSGQYRPRVATPQDVKLVEAIMPELDSDGPHTLAGAICCLAAGAHSTDAAHQEQIAATFYNLCCSDFEGVRVTPEIVAYVADLIKKAKK
jgi:hypothetical protein